MLSLNFPLKYLLKGILEAAHAFSLLPLRGAFSLEWEGLGCFHLLKLLLPYLSNKQSSFLRIGEKNILFSG